MQLPIVNDVVGHPLIVEIFVGLCLTVGIGVTLYQTKKKKFMQKDETGKSLDDYSYRDLFHFFINPEFHTDKLLLAKGFHEKVFF
jgi:hypothetical protein